MEIMDRQFNKKFLEVLNSKRKKKAQIFDTQSNEEIQVEFEDEACQAATHIGYPVVMKMLSKEIHSDVAEGIVKCNIQNEIELRKNYCEMMMEVLEKFPKVSIDGILIKKI